MEIFLYGIVRVFFHSSNNADPNFVNSFGYGDKVYFFFRETAVENINCGKVCFAAALRRLYIKRVTIAGKKS